VAIAILLPSSRSKTDINVLFFPQALIILVHNDNDNNNSSSSSPSLHYAVTRPWGGIGPSSGFWTWAHGARSYVLLTLLEKRHAGTQWPHIFDASGQREVAETRDPSSLYGIRESLENYTAAL
jgi:hypothetical protein